MEYIRWNQNNLILQNLNEEMQKYNHINVLNSAQCNSF